MVLVGCKEEVDEDAYFPFFKELETSVDVIEGLAFFALRFWVPAEEEDVQRLEEDPFSGFFEGVFFK